MNISITFRHLEATDSVKTYATEKLGRLQKYLRQPLRARVTVSVDNNNRQKCCEVEITAGSSHFVASEESEDMFASIDRVVDKLERQISHAHGVAVSRQKGGESAGAFAAATASGEVPEIPAEE